MIDAYAQAYRWRLADIQQLTYPQIVMLNHAADYNRRVLDARVAERRHSKAHPPSQVDMPMVDGKRLDQLTSEELAGYMGPDSPKPRYIKPTPKE